MEILTNLGVDSTFWLQLTLFCVTFVFLTAFVFTPYLSAYHERSQRTVGKEELAKQIFLESEELHIHYETRARQINEDIRTIYDSARLEAFRKQNEILLNARELSNDLLATKRKAIQKQLESERQLMRAEVPGITKAIATKLLGKEVSQ